MFPLEIDVGQTVKVTATFAEAPQTVTGKVRVGSGPESPLSMTNTGDGLTFTAQLVADTPGRWYVRVEGVGGKQAARETTFSVRRSHFA